LVGVSRIALQTLDLFCAEIEILDVLVNYNTGSLVIVIINTLVFCPISGVTLGQMSRLILPSLILKFSSKSGSVVEPSGLRSS